MVLVSLSKIFEKVYYKRLYQYLCAYNLLYRHQYGFRKGYSMDLALVTILQTINASWESKLVPLALVMDLSKAFDTLNHEILLQKLGSYGVRGPAFRRIQTYLTNRLRVTKIGHTLSDSRNIICGVPQGSVLGPLLFLIYVYDITQVTSASKAIMYADDCTCIITAENKEAGIAMANKELRELAKWFRLNKLSLNVGKTKGIFFEKVATPITHSQLITDGKTIDIVS